VTVANFIKISAYNKMSARRTARRRACRLLQQNDGAHGVTRPTNRGQIHVLSDAPGDGDAP